MEATNGGLGDISTCFRYVIIDVKDGNQTSLCKLSAQNPDLVGTHGDRPCYLVDDDDAVSTAERNIYTMTQRATLADSFQASLNIEPDSHLGHTRPLAATFHDNGSVISLESSSSEARFIYRRSFILLNHT